MLTRVLAHASFPGRPSRRGLWLSVAIAAIAALCGDTAAEAKFPAGLVFAHKRTVTVSWDQLRHRGWQFQLCNTNAGPAAVRPVIDGFKFSSAKEPVEDGAVLHATRPGNPLGGGKCVPVKLRAHGKPLIDVGRYSGTFAFVGRGAGIARVRVIVERSVTTAARPRFETDVHLTRPPDFGGLRVERTVTLQLPRGTPGLGKVLRSKEGANRDLAVNNLLAAVGLPSLYGWYGSRLNLALGEKQATLTVVDTLDVYSFDDGVFAQRRGPLSDGELRLSRADDEIRLELGGPSPDAGAAWVAEVHVEANKQRHWEPVPDERRRDLVRWSFPANAKDPHVSIDVELDEDVGHQLHIHEKRPRAVRAVVFFGAEALFVVALLLAALPGTQPPWRSWHARLRAALSGEPGQPHGWLIRVALAAIALLLSMLAVWLIQIFAFPPNLRDPEDSQLGQFLRLFGLIAPPLIGAGFLLSVAWNPDRGFDRRAFWLVGAVIVIAVAAMLAVSYRTYVDPHPGALGDLHALRWLLAASAPLIAFLLCAIVLGASATIVRRSWHSGWRQLPAAPLPRRWVWLGVVLLAVITAGQWTWAVENRYDDFQGMLGQSAWWDSLVVELGTFPLGMLGRLVELLPLLVAIAALPLLAASRGVSETSLGKRDRPIRLLILIFGGVVVATAGVVDGYRVPLPFVLSVVLLYLVLRDREGTDDEPMPADQRKGLVTASLRQEEYRRNRRALYVKLTEDMGLDDYRRELTELRTPPKDPDALSRGPFDDWWENARTAVRKALLPSLFPIGYYVIVVIGDRIDDDLSGTADFGILDLLVGLAAEASTWIVAAFVFGAVYAHLPLRQGPAKALVLSVVFAASLGISAAVLGTGTTWVFRSLEMLVVLGVVGFRLDRATMEGHGFYWRELFDVYHLREARFATGYLTTLALALVGLAQQLLTGNGTDTVTTLLEGIGAVLPNSTG